MHAGPTHTGLPEGEVLFIRRFKDDKLEREDKFTHEEMKEIFQDVWTKPKKVSFCMWMFVCDTVSVCVCDCVTSENELSQPMYTQARTSATFLALIFVAIGPYRVCVCVCVCVCVPPRPALVRMLFLCTIQHTQTHTHTYTHAHTAT
jgi:hypothetical protein